ncbi:MAG: Arc family DNA-binding protein [Vicinamibacterales bacterium]|nr:Arc family DNA-binding protein [Vicinamibacterales bacterium]
MPVNISIKDVPDDIAEALRLRAQANHRSMQGELMAMIERHTNERPFKALELWNDIQKLGLRTPSESTQWIREDRDSR